MLAWLYKCIERIAMRQLIKSLLKVPNLMLLGQIKMHLNEDLEGSSVPTRDKLAAENLIYTASMLFELYRTQPQDLYLGYIIHYCSQALELCQNRRLYPAHHLISLALIKCEKKESHPENKALLLEKIHQQADVLFQSFNFSECYLFKGYSLYRQGLANESNQVSEEKESKFKPDELYASAYNYFLQGIENAVVNNCFDPISLDCWECLIELERKDPTINEHLPKDIPSFNHFESSIFYKMAKEEYNIKDYSNAFVHMLIAIWTFSLQLRFSIKNENIFQNELKTNPKLLQYRELLMKINAAKNEALSHTKQNLIQIKQNEREARRKRSKQVKEDQMKMVAMAIELRKAELLEKQRHYQEREEKIKAERIQRAKEEREKELAEIAAQAQIEKTRLELEAKEKAEKRRSEKEARGKEKIARRTKREFKKRIQAETKKEQESLKAAQVAIELERKREAEEQQKKELQKAEYAAEKKAVVTQTLTTLFHHFDKALSEKEKQQKLDEEKRLKEIEEIKSKQLAEDERIKNAPKTIFQLAFNTSKKLDGSEIKTTVEEKENPFSRHLFKNKITEFKTILMNEIKTFDTPEGKELKKLFDVLDQFSTEIKFPQIDGFHSISDALNRLETKAGATKAFAVGGVVRDTLLGRNPFRLKRTFNNPHPNLEIDVDLVADLSIDKLESLEKLRLAFPEKEGYLLKASELEGLYTIINSRNSAKLFQVMNSRYLCASPDSPYKKDPLLYDALSRDLLHNSIYADKDGHVYAPLFGTLVAFSCRLIHLINKSELYAATGQEFKQLPEIISLLEDPRRFLRALTPLITYVRLEKFGLRSEFTLSEDFQRAIPQGLKLLIPEKKELSDFTEEQKQNLRLLNIFLGVKVFCRPESAAIFNLFTHFGVTKKLFPGLFPTLTREKTDSILQHECVTERIYTSFLVHQHAQDFKALCERHRVQDTSFFNELNNLIKQLVANKPLIQICFEHQPKKIASFRETMQKKLGPHKIIRDLPSICELVLEKLHVYSLAKLPPTVAQTQEIERHPAASKIYQGLDGNFYFFTPANSAGQNHFIPTHNKAAC